MNSDDKFEQVYSQILEENSEELETLRLGTKSEFIRKGINVIIVVVIGILLYVISYRMFYPRNEGATNVIIIYVSIVVIVYIKLRHPLKELNFLQQKYGYGSGLVKTKTLQYRDQFKTRVIKTLLNSFNENIDFFPYSGISSSVYSMAEFEKYDIFRSEDLMQGTLSNNCNFSMAEVLTERKTIDSDRDVEYKTLFCGILSKVETPKPFNARLYIRKDKNDKNLLNKTFSEKLPFEDLRLEMDSQEFEEMFDVYCSDKIVGMQLLTPDIMQLLIDFRKEMNMNYEITIKNSCIYIRFMSGEMFEAARATKFSLDKETLYKYYKMLDFTFSLTDELINLIKDTEL